MNKKTTAIFWFRRDLRLYDNAGLYRALKENDSVLPIFIFDDRILQQLNNPYDKRIAFIHHHLELLNQQLEKLGSRLLIKKGTPLEIFRNLLLEYNVHAVYLNHDYESYAMERDSAVKELLATFNISFLTFKDQVIFEKDEVLSGSGKPYTVYTPYAKKWKSKLHIFSSKSYSNEKYFSNFFKTSFLKIPDLSDIGFKNSEISFTVPKIDLDILRNYKNDRDYPAINGTTHAGIHLRFGTLSIRECVRIASEQSETWLNELIWREFFMMILHHFPYVETRSFRKEYDAIRWRNNEREFEAWCQGKTGYPLVDAGMHELNATGFMHNRVRMVTASFLTKHLLIDWRWGEAYFAQKLLDFELSSNNGNWQWAAGCGCDAAPYFRIFNPTAQQEKFDPKGEYVRKWVPELNTPSYSSPIVEHAYARVRALNTYKEALGASPSGT